ncbi:MAG: RNA methyltransferase [Phycisphaeraceae bacterium]|nr:RNA methyltransferase [Phycisphaeraceae bacterium]
MPAPQRLTSLDNPRVKAMIALLRHRQRSRTGSFVAEGWRQVARALQAKLTLREIYLCPDLLDPALSEEIQKTLLDPGPAPAAAQFYVTPALLHRMAYRGEHAQGVLAVFTQPTWSLADLSLPPDPLILVAVGTTKPGNLGALARSAEAAGAAAMFVADTVVDPFNPNAIHASTGAVFSLPIVADSSPNLLTFLAQHGIRLFPAAPHAALAHDQADLTGPTALVIGTEHAGLSYPWLNSDGNPPLNVDQIMTPIGIPMAGRLVDSLNAAVAGGILLFEAHRQRRGKNCVENQIAS